MSINTIYCSVGKELFVKNAWFVSRCRVVSRNGMSDPAMMRNREKYLG